MTTLRTSNRSLAKLREKHQQMSSNDLVCYLSNPQILMFPCVRFLNKRKPRGLLVLGLVPLPSLSIEENESLSYWFLLSGMEIVNISTRFPNHDLSSSSS
mmetsp:Transcript_29420/g.68086  ORF Transcript_29420/g.68086 Transcript_29420/m.68086 type:complete len:100 (+) Transcript_29420:388-687(+)